MGEDYDEEPMLYLLQQPNGYWKIGDEDCWTVCHQVTGDAARLIAAAPELLAVLLDIAAVMEDNQTSGDLLLKAKAAINKAEGRSE